MGSRGAVTYSGYVSIIRSNFTGLFANTNVGGDIDSAYVSRNRRHVLRQGSFLLADIVFDELRFGEVNRILKQLSKYGPAMAVVPVSALNEFMAFYSMLFIGRPRASACHRRREAYDRSGTHLLLGGRCSGSTH